MLTSMPTPAPMMSEFIEPAAPSTEPAKPVAAALNNSLPDDDDDDEALQAVLLASLMEEAAQKEEIASSSSSAKAEQEARFNAAVKPPLIAKATSIASFLADANVSVDARRGLERLGQPPQNLMLAKVRGDGHCLFRVVAGALVLGAAWAGRDAVDALVEHLRSAEVHESAHEAARLVIDLLAERDVLAALNDEADDGKPAKLVSALRRAAVAYMRAHAERFRHCGEGTEGEGEAGWEAYCEAIEDASRTRYGGHPELVALSESLRVRVDIYDTGALSGGIATYHLGESLPETSVTVRGLRRGLHFDLLLRAQTEGDAAVEELD